MIEYIFYFAITYVFFTQFQTFQTQLKNFEVENNKPGRVELDLLNDSYTRDDYAKTALAFNCDPTEVMTTVFPTIGANLFGDDLQYGGPNPNFVSQYRGSEYLGTYFSKQITSPSAINPSNFDLFSKSKNLNYSIHSF